MKKAVFAAILLVQLFSATAQEPISVERKGQFFFYWGYNRAAFTNSDIHFKGPGYDFKLMDVHANDRPQDFVFSEYFGITTMWQPQYVYRLGYFINNHWNISFGLDHMKYIMVQNQRVGIEGVINEGRNPYNGTYENGDEIALRPFFLTYEHSDGLNYLNATADYHFMLYQIPSGKFRIDAFAGGGLGLQIPKSNVRLFSKKRNDSFHLAGWGMHADAGLSFIGWNLFFIRTQVKGGFQHMPDILTRPDDVPDRASQFFWFGMLDFAFGVQWHF